MKQEALTVYYYQPFLQGEVGFLLGENGLKALDIEGLYPHIRENDPNIAPLWSQNHLKQTMLKQSLRQKRGLPDNSPELITKIRWQKQYAPLPIGDQFNSVLGGYLQTAITELLCYFQGEEMQFTIPLDLSSGTPFQQRVWQALQQIPYGQTISYKTLAMMIDNPKAVRAVGGANGQNPLPIIIPCHRVIQADGNLGGYSGGVAIKRELLALEGVVDTRF